MRLRLPRFLTRFFTTQKTRPVDSGEPPTPKPATPLRQLADRYFSEHPEEKDGVLKAWYAYHAPHHRVEPNMPLHNFTNGSRESKCVWCGRSREMVRHDDLTGRCLGRPPEIREIADVLKDEEEIFSKNLNRAKNDVEKVVSKHGLTGKSLAILHHTYGHDPETVATLVDVPSGVMAEYHESMETERAKSRLAHKSTVIAVKGL